FGPSGTGTATPNQVAAGGAGKITVSVSRGNGSPNNISTVIVDTSTLFGHAPNTDSLSLNDSGTNGDSNPNDNIWSRNFTIPLTATRGGAVLPFRITDAQARTFDGTVIFTITDPPGSFTPSTANIGTTVR